MTTSDLVPGLLPIAIDGHAYLCEPAYQRQTVPVMRQQADTSTEAGEQSLNPQGLWRRSQESWHHGAGQPFLDGRQGDTPTDPHRFRVSKGLDIWTRGQVSLLHSTLKPLATTNENLYLAVAQTPPTLGELFVLYVADGNDLYAAALPFTLLNTIAFQRGTGWTATNATISTTETWFTLTATAAAAVSATSPTGTAGIPVEEGRRYGYAFQSFYISGGAGRTPQIALKWYDAAGVFLSDSATAVGTIDDDDDPTNGASVFGSAVAPTDAAFAAVHVSFTAASASGEVHWARSVSLGPYENVETLGAPDTWFDADIQAGESAQPIESLATDGTNVWAALGTSGLHRTSTGGGSSTANVPAAPASGQISLVGYANGFLLAAGSAGTSATRQNTLWRVDDPLGTPSLSEIKTHPNTSFAWTFIASGRSCVYAGGNSGGNGEIYKITFDPNTGTLAEAASPASFLPDGETIHALYFYAGTIILGTGRGVRIGQADGAGNIDYGPLIETDWPVRCLEPQDRYCWFGWTKYDGSNSGLGRIDLGYLTDTLTPAWASDLMTADTSQGEVVSVVTMAPYGYTDNQRPPVRVFSVAGEGVYIEDPTSRVASGTLDTGAIRFSTSEPKTTRSIDVRHHALPAGGPISVEMQRDDSGTWETIGSSSTTDSYGPAASLSLLNEEAEAMEFRFTLDRPDNDGEDFSRSPELTRWTAKVLPTPSTIDEMFVFAIQMKERIKTSDGQDRYQDVPAEVTYLKNLERSRAIVEFQVGSETFEGYVAGSEWAGVNWNSPKREFAEGTLQVTMMTARG